MAFTKKVMSKTKKIFIYGSGTLLSFLIILFGLSFYGVNVQTSGDQVCGETCVSYFNISLDTYSLCMGSTFTGITVEPQVQYEIYKADARYRSDNPARWKPYEFKANTCLKNGTIHEFKLVGHKDPNQTIKWGLTLAGPDKDPFWYGINTSTTTSVSGNISMELGTQMNITTNISGASTVCVDIDHPDYGNNYTCGSPNANFLFNISYFRKTTFNDSSASQNLTWGIFLKVPETFSTGAVGAGQHNIFPFINMNDSNQATYANNTDAFVAMHFSSINFTVGELDINNLRFLMNWTTNGSTFDFDAGTCNSGTSTFCFYNWSSGSFVALGTTLPNYAGSFLSNFSLSEDAISPTGKVWIASDTYASGNGVLMKLYEMWLSYDNIDTSTADENFTLYVDVHKYDEIKNVSINLTGFAYQGQTPTSVKVYVNGSLSNDIGYMVNNQGTINKLSDDSTSKNYSFSAKSTKTDYLKIIKGAQISYAYFNVTGFNILTGLEGVCYQESAKTAGGCGGLNTGNYSADVTETYYNDSDWDTRTSGYVATNGQANYYINYSKPTAFLYNGTKLQFKFMQNYAEVEANATILPSCMGNSQVKMKLNFSHDGTYATFRVFCYDTAWENLYSYSSLSNYNGMGLYEEGIWWNFINNSLTNISVEVGDIDGTPEYNYTGWFKTTGKSINFNNTLTTYLATCTEDSDHFCQVPIYFTTQKSGLLQVNDINISYVYNINPVMLDKTLIENFLGNSSGFTKIPITFSSSQNGTLQINDLRFDYKGGNDTISVHTNPSICYQETATTSTCGSGVGTYTSTANYVYVNYTKPSANNATWTVKHGSLSPYNVTIPSSCFNFFPSVISLRMFTNYTSASTTSISYGQCLNSSGWSTITSVETVNYGLSVSDENQPEKLYDGDWDTYQAYYTIAGSAWGLTTGGGDITRARWYEEGIWWQMNDLNLIVHYSDYYKNLPYTWTDKVFFIPRTNSSKNVTAYGQTSTIPVYNITTTNYGGNANFSMRVNESFSCLNISWNSTGSTKPANQHINTSWQKIYSDVGYLTNKKIWFWADLENCNASNQRILTPWVELQSYCIDCKWGGS